MQIAIDTGGTFTDCVYAVDGELRMLKLASTPSDPSAAVLDAVTRIAAGGTVEVRHGTTVGTNALLERKGARVAFVTTTGFEDSIEIGRQARPSLYNWFFEKPQPLAPEELRFGVVERTAADGSILKAVEGLGELKQAIRAGAPESIAISLLFSFANETNERAVVEALASLNIPISASHEILPEFREYERGSTVLINAYLAPKMRKYLNGLDESLARNGSSLHVMQSSGGIVPAAFAARQPVRTILSGPAGGVVGAMAVAKAAGYTRILTFDMGGTSTDVALVDSDAGLESSTEFKIQNMPVAVPMLNIHTVGAGGGSLAGFDRAGALKVGPESAGADPGPICYGRGEQPTVTDANLILGRIDPERFLGGAMKLDIDRARNLLDKAKGKLRSIEEFAAGIVRLADSHMEKALRRISVEQGRDPRDFVLVSFGGAGPLHACALARALKIPKVLVPPMPGALSAFGILVSDVIRDYSRTVMLRPGDPSLENHFKDLEHTGAAEMPQALRARSLDCRYAGQGYELAVDWQDNYVSAFHRLHELRYGYADTKRPVEIVNVRVRLISASQKYTLPSSRPGLSPGNRIEGPAVIPEYSATTYIPEGCVATVDQNTNLVIEIK